MERERFMVRSLQGPRNPAGVGVPIYSDVGFGNLDPAAHFMGASLTSAPWLWHTYFNDFDTIADWNSITDTGSWDIHSTGSGTVALADGDNGLLLLTCAAADDDRVFAQKKGESFKYEAGKVLAFAIRFKVSDATQSDIIAGLQITDTTPLAVSDGIFFQKDDGDALIDFHVGKGSTFTDVTNLATLVDATFVTLSFVYDGLKLRYGVNGVEKGTVALTNMPDTEELTPAFGIQNGEAVAKTMTVDYLYATKYTGRT